MIKRAARLTVIVVATLLIMTIRPAGRFAGNGFDGYAWLSWSNDSRQLYLAAFLHAYRLGVSDACHSASEIGKPDWTIREIVACEERQMSFSLDLPNLDREVTEFYQAYPEDQPLGLDVLLRQFSDQKRRTAAEVHTLFKNNKPM